ncbi:hypothetical protein B0H16DRAFT_1744913 [Mycena metata]|uniref:Uncharacterized protein n=1 Tax=Mycena metata TaxID=1033252 RepID=A0AAD7MD51_9AGAR|nr:hypothetical protein B0H16DRAFT_1744913 [Mycena metata]
MFPLHALGFKEWSALPHDLEKGLPRLIPHPAVSIPSNSPHEMLPASSSVLKSLPLHNLPTTKPATSDSVDCRLWFNTYRKFFTLTVTLNRIGLLLTALGKWDYPRRYTGAFVLGNLQVAILMRNELFCRFLYLTVNTLFAKWTPLWFRLACTSILQHLGGIHSGCAVSGALWLVLRIVLIIAEWKHYPASIISAGVVTNVAVFISIASAYKIRSVIIPWLTVRKVPVVVEIPSPKVAIIRFERGMQQGLLARISRGPCSSTTCLELYPRDPNLANTTSRNFTQALVDNPPRSLWTRQLKFAGVSNTSKLYKRGIRVCTGTGLGASLSTCLQSPDWHLIWIGSD